MRFPFSLGVIMSTDLAHQSLLANSSYALGYLPFSPQLTRPWICIITPVYLTILLQNLQFKIAIFAWAGQIPNTDRLTKTIVALLIIPTYKRSRFFKLSDLQRQRLLRDSRVHEEMISREAIKRYHGIKCIGII